MVGGRQSATEVFLSGWQRFVLLIPIIGCIIIIVAPFATKNNVVVLALSSTTTTTSSLTKTIGTTTTGGKVTISVCTGADCRIDGASHCLRRIQQATSIVNNNVVVAAALSSFSSNNTTTATTSTTTTPSAKKAIVVEARPCIGPCGDGPNVVVLLSMDGHNKKGQQQQQRVVSTEPQPNRGPGSLVPANVFGDNPRGVYQVRTPEHVDFVLNLAKQAAQIPHDIATTTITSSIDNEDAAAAATFTTTTTTTTTTSSRPWYDRPRNERRVLQRVMQFLVLIGLYQYDKIEGSIGSEQWIVAAILGLASNWIMKENIIVFLWDKMTRLKN